MKESIITAIVMMIILLLAIQYEKYELKQATTCTPSEENKMVMERLDELTQGQTYISDLIINK